MKTFEPDERFFEFMRHSVHRSTYSVADWRERRSSFFPFVVIYCDRLMANIDFALRTSAASASLRRGTAADLRLLLALDEFWGDAAPEKAPSTRVNRATTIRTPTKKVAVLCLTKSMGL